MPRPAVKKSTPPATYREAYAVLARIAGELENGEADLDRVLPLIQEAQAAYEVCRERIEALQDALGERQEPAGDEEEAEDDDEPE